MYKHDCFVANPLTVLEIALRAERIKFVSGHAPQSLVHTLWFHRLRPGTEWYKIVFTLLAFWFFFIPLHFIHLADTNLLTIDENTEEDRTRLLIFGLAAEPDISR